MAVHYLLRFIAVHNFSDHRPYRRRPSSLIGSALTIFVEDWIDHAVRALILGIGKAYSLPCLLSITRANRGSRDSCRTSVIFASRLRQLANRSTDRAEDMANLLILDRNIKTPIAKLNVPN